MIIAGAYQPLATKTLDEITELERQARELYDAHRLDRPDAHGGLTANDLSTVALLADVLAALADAVWRSFILPDHTATWKAILGAQKLAKTYGKTLRQLQAKDDTTTEGRLLVS